ncbi:hypothetical protein OKA06_04720 [Novosphingobium sp. MW5]|nr:hypothetical protein [Novosphingobium sp. MW5]
MGQRLGLEWLARPVARFVIDHPQAECDLFAGDLTVAALIAWSDMVNSAPDETMLMIAQDYEWLRREAQEDPWEGSILKLAVAALDEAET